MSRPWRDARGDLRMNRVASIASHGTAAIPWYEPLEPGLATAHLPVSFGVGRAKDWKRGRGELAADPRTTRSASGQRIREAFTAASRVEEIAALERRRELPLAVAVAVEVIAA